MMYSRKIFVVMCSLNFVANAGAQQSPQPPDADPARSGRRLSEQPRPDINMPPPNVGMLLRSSNGSLYRATALMDEDPRLIKPSDVNYFAVPEPKPKTLLKHDLLTIVVNEESEFTSDASTDTKKDAGIDGKVTQFPGLSLSNFALRNTIGSVVPELNVSGNRSYKGSGTVDRKDSFTARIQAEVLDVKPNGTLVLQARTRIVTDEEEQLLVLTGVCRVQDVTPDNTILSSQLFDKDMRKKHSGAVRDATKRGWVPRVLDWANPF